MENRMLVRLNGIKKTLLGASAVALVLMPIAAGLLWSPAAQGATCKVEGVMATHTIVPYPKESEKAGETGQVMLQLTIARNGHVSSAKVSRSSGHARLDQAALNHVRQNYLWRPLSCASAQTDLKVVFNLAAKGATFNQDVWIKHMENDGAKVERLGGNSFRVTLPPPARH